MKSALNLILLVAVVYVKTACATTVEWDLAQSLDAEVWDSGPLWQIGGSSKSCTGLFYQFFVTHDNVDYIASDKFSSFRSTWVTQASKGEVVNYENMFKPGQEYFYKWISETETHSSDYSIPIDWEDSVYLAMATIAYDEGVRHIAYGWIELGMGDDFDPVVKSSAWDVDGGAMYVGGGAVPEPTSALLLLVGSAALLLRRRRRL